MQYTELRPLGAGELLDRAITLYVRRFALIVAVLAVVSVPVILVQALAAPQSAHAFSDLGRVLTTAGNSPESRQASEDLARDGALDPKSVLVMFVAMLLRIVMWGAVVAALAAAYAGTRLSVAQTYRIALRRFLAQLVVGLAFGALAGLAFVPVFILYLLIVFGAVALAALKLTGAAVTLGLLGVLAILAVALCVGATVFMTYELASVALMTETGNPVEAVGVALRRAFAPGMKRRTLVGGLILILVTYAGALPLITVAALATALTRIDALYFVVLGVGGVLLDGIVAAFAVVYAVDVRVRREGVDLSAALAQPAPSA